MSDRHGVLRRYGILAALWLAVCLAGCATRPEIAPVASPRAVLLAPTRFDDRLAERLAPGAVVLDELIGRLLWERDVHIAAPARGEFGALWSAASGLERPEHAGRAADFDATARALVAALRARGERFDTLVLPQLTIRPGAVHGHSVMWDGVTRRLLFEGRRPETAFALTRRGLQTACTSLRVIAFDAQGERLFERLGGLEVARRLSSADSAGRRSWSERDDLFQDPRALRDGVKLALGPLLRK